MFEKVMYKVKDNTFRVRDFTKKDNVDESKFVETTNQRGAPQMQTQVCVMYKDEYNDIKTKLDNHESEVESLNAIIKEQDSKIKELESKLDEKSHVNSDEVMQLNETISNMKEDHHKEVSKLHQEKSNLEIAHSNEMRELEKVHHDEVLQLSEEVSQVKQEHLQEINKKDKAHSERVETIRSYFLKVVTLDNTEDTSEIIEIEKSVPAIFKPFMRKHVKQIEEFKERKLLKEPEKIIKTHELSGKKEKEEQ